MSGRSSEPYGRCGFCIGCQTRRTCALSHRSSRLRSRCQRRMLEDNRSEVAKKIGAKPEELRQSPMLGDLRDTPGRGRRATSPTTASSSSTAISTRSTRIRNLVGGDAPRPSACQAHVRPVPEVADGRVLAEGSEVHRLRVHRRGLRLLPAASQPDGASTTGSASRCVTCSIRARVRTRSRGRRPKEVWCSADRGKALTRAKRGEPIPTPKHCATPIARQYELGKEMGVRGTPAIVLASGEMLPGYLPPQALAARLKSK